MSESMQDAAVLPTSMAFEKRYSDDSRRGVEYAVRLVPGSLGPEVEMESIHEVRFPVAQVPWLIACLTRIWRETVCHATIDTLCPIPPAEAPHV